MVGVISLKGKPAPLSAGLRWVVEHTNSLAAVNGRYFVIGSADGTPGDLAGVSILDGHLVSEAVDGRTSFVLPTGSGEGVDIGTLSDHLTASSWDGAIRIVDGLNRKPGLIRACGGEGGDQPTEKPLHDFTCTDSSELIQFTPDFGTATEPGDGADWLRVSAHPGRTVRVTTNISSDGAPLAESGFGVVNGGPRLLSGGSPDITAYAEDFVHPDDPEFYYRFGVRRNPRTLAVITSDGNLLSVAVDGHEPGYSAGASFEESAGIMRALGAREATNLDGGSSTTMTLGNRLINRPSDATGERPVGDAVAILP